MRAENGSPASSHAGTLTARVSLIGREGFRVFYWLLKWVLIGPVLKTVFRPQTEGVDNVPDEGPAILASNHLSYADWLFMPLTLTRHQGLAAEVVLLRRRSGADRPVRRR